MSKCIFCPNRASSKEDMFPKWILARVKTREKMTHTLEGRPRYETDDQRVLVKCVCKTCNNGWMSRLESKSIPTIGNLLDDISLTLDTDQQKTMALWAAKTTMVADAGRRKGSFYTSEEREALKDHSQIPAGTSIWVGRFFGRSLSVITNGSAIRTLHGTAVGTFHICTIVVGHLIFQVMTLHPADEYKLSNIRILPTEWPWQDLLTQIWSEQPRDIAWPPADSFSHYGDYPYAALVFRWKRPDGHEVRTLRKS